MHRQDYAVKWERFNGTSVVLESSLRAENTENALISQEI